MKFIHTSDWHLGNNYSRFDESQRDLLKEARFKAVENLFEYAKKNSISLIVSAGDQFDNGDTKDLNLLYRLFSIIKNYPQIKVVMIAGNHDPYMDNCIYKKIDKKEYPENIIFITDKEVVCFEDINVKIYAASLTSKFSDKNPISWIDDKKDDYFKIAIAHGSLKINTIYNPNDFPIDMDFAKSKNIDYFALGHWHSYYKHDDNTYYCGTFEALQFDDDGYAIEVILSKNNPPMVKKITGLNVYTWLTKSVILSDDNFNKFFDELKDSSSKKTILNLVLTGYLSMDNYRKLDELINAITHDYFKIFASNRVSLKPDAEDIIEHISHGAIKKIVEDLISIKKNNLDVSSIIKDKIDINDAADRALMMINDFFNENKL
jgi:DNA repair exonuclease SbcCD nuclease subunit